MTESKRYLMLIEADPSIKKTVKNIVSSTTYFHLVDISNKTDGGRLEKAIIAYSPKLIVFDIDNFAGDDALEIIRVAKKACMDCALIILSESDDYQKLKEAVYAGATLYVNKAQLEISLPGILGMIIRHETIDELLTKKDEELSSILETQQEMICRFFPDTRLTYVNRAYARFFGKIPEDLIGRKYIEFIPEEDREEVLGFLSSYSREKPIQTYRHAVKRPDGSTGWHEWTDYAFFDKQGRLTSFQAVGRDISKEIELTNALKKSEENERRLIARDLHDHIGQMLTYTKLKMEQGMATTDEAVRKKICNEAMDLVIRCMQEVRMVSRRVVAGFVKEGSFRDAVIDLVDSFERMATVKITFCADHIPDNLNIDAKNNLYRIMQEAFTNILKHAQATRVSIQFKIKDDYLYLHIRDNGVGVDVSSPAVKNGFITMRYRVEQLGGTIKFSSEPGKYFKLQLKIPAENILNLQ